MKRPATISRAAFTLVEVILAIVICSGMVGALIAFYNQALDIRTAVTEEVEVASASRAVMDHMTSELRSALSYPFLNMGVEGATDHFTFLTTVIPGPAVWAVRKTTDDPIPPEHDLEMAGYRLRLVTNDDGTSSVDGLERTSQRILSAEQPTEGREITVSYLTARVKYLRLRYYDGANWQDSWTGGNLPTAIEITLGASPLPDGQSPDDYASPTFRRTVFLPGKSGAMPKATAATSTTASSDSSDGGTQ